MNIFYLYGEEIFLINQKIQEIIKNDNQPKIVNFNTNDYKLMNALNEISTFSLFGENKIIIFNNINQMIKNNFNEAKQIVKSIELAPESTTLIFVDEIMDKKNLKGPLYDFLNSKAQCFEFKKLNDKEIFNYVKNYILSVGATISDLDLHFLLSKIPNKLMTLLNEIDKLIMLDKNITQSAIDDLIPKYDLNNSFDFINSFQNSNTNEILKIYYEKINQGETIQNLIGQLSNVLDLCSKIHSFKLLKYSQDEIADKLKKHPFVIKRNEDFLKNIGYKNIEKYLAMLANLDIQIKKGLVDEKVGFERFLLEVIK